MQCQGKTLSIAKAIDSVNGNIVEEACWLNLPALRLWRWDSGRRAWLTLWEWRWLNRGYVWVYNTNSYTNDIEPIPVIQSCCPVLCD